MAVVCCKVVQKRILGLKVAASISARRTLWLKYWEGDAESKRSVETIPFSAAVQAFQPKPEDHEKYGGNPEQAHKLHLITRIRSWVGRPYWEKEMIDNLGLQKAHKPVVHKNIPSVNKRLKVIKHLIRVQPLKLPYGLPTEEDMSDTYLNSTGQLMIRKKLQPVETKSLES
ncbi:large ribosomal subunit protein uL30m [Mixophyes fleayi]|uniref:large ribosomal subunit protein uL30m n=1 Tax=Mixophyes fleayi TaxID=3061075 RepID=UPI003F4DD15F